MTIVREATIWFPGVYAGRDSEEYTQPIADLPVQTLIELVQKRVKEDGEWAIAEGLVGDNEDKMRRMMEFAADPKNIQQCVYHPDNSAETVDWVCRDLANASKMMVR